ncbi:hypothetical protein HDU86_003023 [Geranomyces michiganensis]|nr:hypothetical protein HDU86_003023 [Geranomyces michiganensis]
MSILSFFERHRELKKVAKYSGRRKDKSSSSSSFPSTSHANSSALSVKIPDAGSGNWKGDAYKQSVTEYYAHTPPSRPRTLSLAASKPCAGPASAPPSYRRQAVCSTSSSGSSSTASSFGRSASASSGISVTEGILVVLATDDEDEDKDNTASSSSNNNNNYYYYSNLSNSASSPSLSLASALASSPSKPTPPPLPLSYTPPPPPLFTPPPSSSSSSRFESRSCVSFDEPVRPRGPVRASTFDNNHAAAGGGGKRISVLFWKKHAERLDPSKIRSSEDYNSLDHVEYHQR